MDHQIKGIIFDLGKVVVNFDHMSACRKLSLHSPFNEYQIYFKIFETGLETDFDTGKIDQKGFCEKVKAGLMVELSESAISQIWTSIFSPNPGIDRLIRRLADRYRLLCLSNTNPLHFNYCLKHFDILKVFELFILSYRVGIKKPHPDIYRRTLQAADLKAAECIYIDDIAQFTEAAGRIGIQSFRFISVPRLEQELSLIGVL